MKKALFCGVTAFFLLMISCDDDEIMNPINPIGETKIYTLESVSDPNVFGTATFIRNADNSTSVQLEIENLPTNADNPRSEERRVGKECRSRRVAYRYKD